MALGSESDEMEEQVDTILIEPQRPLALNGDKIRRLRKRAGLTQRELGQLVGVSGRAVRYWEAGDRKPQDLQVIRKLVEMLAPEKIQDNDQGVLFATDGTPIVIRTDSTGATPFDRIGP